jgi:MarR family transcriptional regulator, organic hydroperoxide resistance regulator
MEADQLDRLTRTLLIFPEVLSRKIDKQVLTIALKDMHLGMGIYHLLVLQVLADEGDQAVNDVGQKLAISKSQMTFATNHLVDQGLINRQLDDEDRRKIRINLTLRGRWVMEELTKIIQREMTRLLNDLSDEDIIQLESGLQILDGISKKLDDWQ